MTAVLETNPFEVLRLDPTASEEEVVRQAGRLRQRATDEAAQNTVRQAVQALTASPAARNLHALLTHPRPAHHAAALDRFAATFRRLPASANPPACPPLDLQEFIALLRSVVADGLELPAVEFEGVPAGESPEEIRRQSAEALWQSLLFDSRG
jgi:hypothetical protein